MSFSVCLARLWLSGFGLGYLPMAPATWGSLVGLGLGWALSFWPFWLRLLGLVLATAFSLWATYKLSPLPSADPPWFVADENVALLLLACLYPYPTLPEAALAFFAFRFWDTVKLWPADALEQLPSPWGIFADDGIAIGYTFACLLLFGLG